MSLFFEADLQASSLYTNLDSSTEMSVYVLADLYDTTLLDQLNKDNAKICPLTP